MCYSSTKVLIFYESEQKITMKKFFSHISKRTSNQVSSLLLKLSLSYSMFLIICLFLGSIIFTKSMKQSEDGYWNQNKTIFIESVASMDHCFSIIDTSCRQLARNDYFYRLVSMESNNSDMFYYTAMQAKSQLSDYFYMPALDSVDSFCIYLRNSNYVLANHVFDSATLYYYGKEKYISSGYSLWHKIMLKPSSVGNMISMEPFASSASSRDYLYILDLDNSSYRNIPATITFTLNYQALEEIFSGTPLGNDGYLLAVDANGYPAFTITSEHSHPADAETLSALSYQDSFAVLKDESGQQMHVTSWTSEDNGWQYYLVQPHSLYAAAFRNSQQLFLCILMFAIIAGLVLVLFLAGYMIQPVRVLDNQLKESVLTNELLQEEIEQTRPIICNSYTRRLMLGLVTSEEEIRYIQEYLGLTNPDIHFNVLYTICYDNRTLAEKEKTDIWTLISGNIQQFFTPEYPWYIYSPADRIYAILLCTETPYDTGLITFQSQIIRFHDYLLEEYGVWFYAGIGMPTNSLSMIWECYQQAQEATEYTSKNYIFLPYEIIQKRSDVYYYPSELSTRLVHFINTGNKKQVQEIFTLLQNENIEKRSLQANLLRFLMTDIRNTLLRVHFSIRQTKPDNTALLEKIERQFNDHLSFKLCEDIALNLCELAGSQPEGNDLIQTIKVYIQENYKDPSLCLSKISDTFNISESYFSHIFKEKCGINFSVYVENLRLEEAARLIKETRCSINELYLQVGYNNVTSFRRAFRKKYGLLPSEYRNS